MVSVRPITDDVNFDRLAKMGSVRFIHFKGAIIPFVVNKYLGRLDFNSEVGQDCSYVFKWLGNQEG